MSSDLTADAHATAAASPLRSLGRIVLPGVAVVVVQLALFRMPAGTWLQGAILGLLNALVVLGMMLVYRANRVLNMAQASIGMYPAALAVGLILFERVPYFAALAFGTVIAIVVGALIDLVVIRRFRNAPRLILMVATIGIAQLFAVAALLVPRIWNADVLIGPGNRRDYGVPFHLRFTIGQQVFRGNDLAAVVVAVVCLFAVTLFLRRTEVGTAVRAAADRGDRAAMLGVPVLRLQTGVWIVASVLSFFGIFFQGAIIGFPLTSSLGIATLVTALAAMALGGFDDLPATLVAAVGIGILDKGVAWHNNSKPEAVYAVLAVVVVVGLLIRRSGRRRAGSGAVSTWQAAMEPRPVPAELRRLPEIVVPRWVGAVAILAFAASLPLWLGPSGEFRAATICALAILALSVVVLTGWAGEVTLGQMGFAAVGGSIGALATIQWHWDLTAVLLFVAVCGAVAAILVGLPSLRFHGVFLAVTTLAFSLAANGYLFNPGYFTWIPTSTLFRRKLLGVWGLEGEGAMYEVCLAVLVLALIGVAGIRRSRSGRALRGVRDNADAAQTYGMRAMVARISAFGISGALAAIAGCLLVYVSQGYDVATFLPEASLDTFIAAVIGGVGSALGGIIGALFYNGSQTWLSGAWALLPSAVGVLVVLLILPGGLAEILYRVRDEYLRWVANRRGIVVPSLVADVRTVEGVPAATGPAGASARSIQIEGPTTPGWLSVRGLDVAYGGSQVLFGVDIDIPRGEITALLGTNGAGKSTLLRSIGGIAPVTAGSIRLGQVDLGKLRPEQVARQGIAQMPGGQGVFPSLTVDENLRIAAWLIRHDHADMRARIAGVYERFPTLATRRHDAAGDLSGGQQQQLALGMALLGDPKLLLVDELSLGLAPAVVDHLMQELAQLAASGTTVVVVEQSVNVALTMAKYAYFMEKGEVRFSGPANDLLRHPDLVRSVFLRGAAEGLRAAAGDGHGDGKATPATVVDPTAVGRVADDHGVPARPSGPALEVHGLSVAFGGILAVDKVDLAVAPGEIVGLIGPNGAGKTTIFDLISGFTRGDAGRVLLHGHDLTSAIPSARARAGLGRSFQDARLFPGLTVEETIALALERWISVRDPLSPALRLPASQVIEAAVSDRVDELVDLFGLGAFRSKFVRELSTGSRRMVDLACALAHEPSVILLDEPSSGIAQREAEALAPLLIQVRERLNASLLVIEHDMSLITTIADRLVGLDQGAVLCTGTPEEVLDHPAVVASYLGSSTFTPPRSSPSLASEQGAPQP